MSGDRILDIGDKLAVAQHVEDILYHIAHQFGGIVQILLDCGYGPHIHLEIFGYGAKHIGLFIQGDAFLAQSAHLILYVGHGAEYLFAGGSDGGDGIGDADDIGNIALIVGEHFV